MPRMSRLRHGRSGLGLTALLVAALVFTACGGDDGGSGTTSAATTGSSETTTSSGEGSASAPSEPSDESDSQPTAGEDEESGSEATDSDAQQVEAALVGYLEARANGEWSRACSYLTTDLRKFYARAASSTQGGGCPGFTRRTTQQLSPGKRSNLTDIDIQSVRIDGGRGRIVYLDSSGERVKKPVRLEAGEWKLSSLLVQLLERARSSR